MFINFCFQSLLKTAADCCWPERQIQRDAWALRTQHVSPNNACTRIVYRWFKRSNGHLALQIWTSLRVSYLGSDARKFFLRALSKPRNCFWIKSRTEEGIGKFSHWKIFRRTKLSWVLERGWESTWRQVEDILSVCCNSKKCPDLRCLSWVRQFLITSKLPSCHD